MNVKISFNQFNVELRDVCKDYGRQRHVSDMLGDINWKTLEDHRTISRLTILHKSVHKIVAINIDEHHANHAKKNYNQKNVLNFPYSSHCQNELLLVLFTPRTVIEWNLLPTTIREAPHVDTLKARLCSIKLSNHFT